MKIKTLAALAVLVTTSLFAGSEGGGGDAVILPDGEVVLADVFLDRNQAQPDNMPKRISINPLLLLQVKKYSNLLSHQVDRSALILGNSKIVELYNQVGVRASELVFYSVKDETELNTYCASGGRKAYILPTGANVTQVACTSGNEIFLVESIFKKMDILNQSILLLHERLTTLRDQTGGKNYGAIAGVTNGLGAIIKLAYRQQNGDRSELSDSEMAKLTNFYKALIEIEYRNKEVSIDLLDWKIHKKGGGLIKTEAEVSEGAFVGVTTVVGSNVVVQDKAVLLDARIFPMKKTAQIEVESGAQVINSKIFGEKIIIGENSKIKNSYLNTNTTFFNSGREFRMTDASINLTAVHPRIQLKDGQEMKKNEYIHNDSFKYFPAGYKHQVYSIELNFKTECQGKIQNYDKSEVEYPCSISKKVHESYRNEEFFKNLEMPAGDATQVTMSKISELKISKLSSREYRRTEVVREVNLKMVIENARETEDENLKVISNGEIKAAGQLKYRYFNMSTIWDKLLWVKIEAALRTQGLPYLRSRSKDIDNFTFLLPNE